MNNKSNPIRLGENLVVMDNVRVSVSITCVESKLMERKPSESEGKNKGLFIDIMHENRYHQNRIVLSDTS